MYLGDPLRDKPLLFMTFQLCFGQYLSNAGTLGDFIVKFKSIVKHDLTQGNAVLVFDRYYTNSSKSYMRMLRQEKIVEVVYTSSLLKCPYHLKLQSTASLKIRCSLIRCLLVPWRHATAGQMHSLSVAGTEDVPVEIVGATVIERRDLSSSHD